MADIVVVVTEQNNTWLIADETVRMPPGEYTHGQVSAWLEAEYERVKASRTYRLTLAGDGRGTE